MKRTLAHAIGASILAFAGIVRVPSFAAAPAPIRLPAETVTLKPSTLPGFGLAQQKCLICHSADYIAYQAPWMNLKQWTAEVGKMQHVYGAPIDDQEIKLLAVYLASSYGDAKSVGGDDGH